MMPISFEFATAQQIFFGAGKSNSIQSLAKETGSRALVVSGTSNPRVQELMEKWRVDGIVAAHVVVRREPTVADVIGAVDIATESACDMVIAIGGGSVIDTGKAVAALITNPGEPLDYLEVVGAGKALKIASAPLIAVPTTAGTGAEVTRNAVLSVPEKKVKVSLRSSTMLPRIALVDPELTYSLPPAITASTGLDALTQCIEPFVSNQANPITDGIAAQGIQKAAKSLLRAYQDGNDAEARSEMALASLCGGIALANAKLGAVHGFAGVLGGMYPIPHGVACARLLPFVMAHNVAAIAARAVDSPYLARFNQVASWLTGNSAADAEEGIAWLQSLGDKLAVPALGEFGVKESDFDEIIAKSKVASSMKGNPIVLTDEELRVILVDATHA
jgi:alcohol dehydrogenase class IV